MAKRDLMETTAPAARLQASDDERAAAVRKAAALIENAAVGRPAVKEKAPEPSDAGLGEIDIEKA
ncbi:hypothetical protein, partial [Serratia marcescens]|uniref:hypothetical protein n=1 Tax=Serratia marcescens TaxID=615 RepID=UPI001954F7E8